jgi:hypothetical protein
VIKYRDGYKYQLCETYHVLTGVMPEVKAENDWICLEPSGLLTIQKGYAWDGPSGPTIDTRDFMRGSLIHDALYQLMRENLLDECWRRVADQELLRICTEDGMPEFRCAYVFKAVRMCGGWAMCEKPVLEAP